MIAIVKYNAGNVQSVEFALQRIGAESEVTDDIDYIQRADKVIFPGVGHAHAAMESLKEKGLDKVIVTLKQPVLGICLGMQLMCRHSDENDTPCLGIFNETVRKFVPGRDLKVPHMGWNALQKVSGWLSGELENEFVYFVHSYYVPLGPDTVAQTDHGTGFSAAMKKDNFYAVQFHPEKSAKAGEKVLTNFLAV